MKLTTERGLCKRTIKHFFGGFKWEREMTLQGNNQEVVSNDWRGVEIQREYHVNLEDRKASREERWMRPQRWIAWNWQRWRVREIDWQLIRKVSAGASETAHQAAESLDFPTSLTHTLPSSDMITMPCCHNTGTGNSIKNLEKYRYLKPNLAAQRIIM